MDLSTLPLFASDAPEGVPEAPKHLSVTELTQKLKSTIEPAFLNVWVEGEISNFRPAASGHLYFSLKDAGASISVALFGWGRKKPPFEMKDGLSVLCRGKISVYPARGSYQLIVDRVEPLGAGALQLAFEQLKEKLAREGLFDTARKRVLPKYPKKIVIITSPTGAAVKDILNVLSRRARHIEVVIVPAVVQGEDAPAQLIRALQQANNLALGDVILLTRGGGSIEDLWCFNSELLARAVASSEIPVISAVGHEIDFTISDFVADLRAPTPSAAAEIVTHHWVDVTRGLLEQKQRLWLSWQRQIQKLKTQFAHLASKLVSPKDKLREQSQKCDDLFLRLERGVRTRLERGKMNWERVVGKLDALSPLRVLERGYSIVRNPEAGGKIIKHAATIQKGQKLVIRFQDGEKTVESL